MKGDFCEVKHQVKNIVFYNDYITNYALLLDDRNINEVSGEKYKRILWGR